MKIGLTSFLLGDPEAAKENLGPDWADKSFRKKPLWLLVYCWILNRWLILFLQGALM